MSTIGKGTFTEATIASAATVDIGSTDQIKIAISGTTTITSLGTGANRIRFLRFLGALTLTHNAASLVLPGAANIATAAGDTAIALSDGSGNWIVHNYKKANGRSVVGPSSKIISISRAMTAASGNVSYAGVGFKPTAVVLIGTDKPSNTDAVHGCISWADQSLTMMSILSLQTTVQFRTRQDFLLGDGGNFQIATVASLDADGFTLTWTLVGAPPASTAQVFAFCLG